MDNTNNHNGNDISKCPFMGGVHKESAGGGTGNREWRPNKLKLNILRQNAPQSDPMGKAFDYAKEFKSLDKTLDIEHALTIWGG